MSAEMSAEMSVTMKVTINELVPRPLVRRLFEEGIDILEPLETVYFHHPVVVFKTPDTVRNYSDWPWRFVIDRNGTLKHYCGLPNYCRTRPVALKRAWWRCKWLYEGTYYDKYKVTQIVRDRSTIDGPKEG